MDIDCQKPTKRQCKKFLPFLFVWTVINLIILVYTVVGLIDSVDEENYEKSHRLRITMGVFWFLLTLPHLFSCMFYFYCTREETNDPEMADPETDNPVITRTVYTDRQKKQRETIKKLATLNGITGVLDSSSSSVQSHSSTSFFTPPSSNNSPESIPDPIESSVSNSCVICMDATGEKIGCRNNCNLDICNDCYQQLKECPYCRLPLSSNRNQAEGCIIL